MTEEHPAAGAPAEPETEPEDPHETLFGAFRQRALALLRAERSLRLYTGIAIAQLLVCTILALTGELPVPRIGITSNGSSLATIPVLILLVSLLLQAVAWGMFLTGLIDTRWPIQVLGLLAFVIAFSQFLEPLVIFPVHLFISMLLITGVLATAVVARWRRRERPRPLGFVLFAVHLGLVLALYGDLYWASQSGGSTVLFGLSLSVQLGLLSFLIITVLFLAGTDFAEWGEVTGERLGSLAERLASRGTWILPALAVLLSAAILADTIRQYRVALVQQLVMAILGVWLVVAVVAAARALHHRRPVRIPVAALVLAAVLDLVISLVAVLASGTINTKPEFSVSGISFASYHHDQEPQFTIERPALWEVKSGGPPELLSVSGLHAANQGLFYVVSYTSAEAGPDPMATWVKACCPGQDVVAGNPHPYKEWTESDFTDTTASGRLLGTTWTRTDGDRVWLLYGISNPAIVTLNTPVFRHMVDTFKPGVAEAAGKTAEAAASDRAGLDRVLAINGVLWIVVLLAACLFLIVRRRTRPGLAAAAILLSLVGGLYVLQSFGSVLAAFGVQLQVGPVHLQGLRIQGEQAALAIITVAAVAWFSVRRRLSAGGPALLALVGLAVGLQVLSWMFFVFDQQQASGGLIGFQVAFVSLALLWDIVMSGGAMAQGHGRWFPRHSRVLIYFGFDVLVAATVLYFASLRDQVTGAAAGLDVNTVFYPQTGMIILGVPMLLALFVLKLGRLRTRSHHRPLALPAGGEG